MPSTKRINPKTGKEEFRGLFQYYTPDGVLHYNNTGWCDSKEKAKEEAKKLKKIKETEIGLSFQRRDILIYTALQEFIADYEKKANRKTIENTSTDNTIWRLAKTISRRYTPAEIQRTQVKDVNAGTFRNWLAYMNNNTEISGSYVRNLKYCLTCFNNWLRDNNYYTDSNVDIEIDIAMQRTKLKPKSYKNRQKEGKRIVLTNSNIEKVCNYFRDQGLGEFKNFYYYTLFYFLFYSGVRVEEAIGLQWRYVDLNRSTRKIEICNAINQRELRENVKARMEAGKKSQKNEKSRRTIPIFDWYYELLIDYKNSYKYEFNLSNVEMDECFVFPKLSSHNPKDYQATDQLTIKLKQALEAVGLPKTDCQMLRHSCATFLIRKEPYGLGYKMEKVYKYFGHTDTKMLQDIYAQVEKEDAEKELADLFSDIYNPEPEDVQTEKDNTQTRLADAMKKKLERADENRKDRIYQQIDMAIAREQEKYYYLKKDRWVINEYIRDKIEASKRIIFVEED